MINAFFRLFNKRNYARKSFRVKTKLAVDLARDDVNWKSFSKSRRSFSQDRRENENENISRSQRQLPTLIYVQNPITWLINKIDFKMLKKAWDPEFDEAEFKRGTIQAVSVICALVSKNLWDGLRGLLTQQALTRLQKEVELNWSDEKKRNFYLEPSDVKLALPRKVHFLRIAEKKFVDIDMMFVVMKFKDAEPSLKNELLLIELISRFHRNYTTGEIPNWTVTHFKVTQFNNAVGAQPSK